MQQQYAVAAARGVLQHRRHGSRSAIELRIREADARWLAVGQEAESFTVGRVRSAATQDVHQS
jgi:hypothetical protein